MQDKVVIVTGANSGIGKIAARELAKKGATVVMVCRSQERGAAALQEIKQVVPAATIHLMLCDLSSQASIHKFAGQFKAEFDRLDVLLNNAGALFTSRKTSVDGIELTFALNHLGYYQLTLELLDLLKASAPARIVNVSSIAHKGNTFNFDDYQRSKKFTRTGFKEYGESKLANLLFTYELARRLEGTGVTVNALHPGFVYTGFGSNNGGWMKLLMNTFGRMMAITPEKGAETSIYLASSAEVEGVTGKYFDNKKEKQSSKQSHDRAAQKRLWALSEEITGVKIEPA